ncbi:exosome complex component RRP46 isoform X1 [Drosophila innubila]|uniref:exosome complex component RRP46 isoform X1 n=1 Tax=Drosophila innubila TaxID=198719 RepID=UPI00148DDB3E|nr:exosome complex component RRP46 isoform X1 [Drosophila innubila]
MGKTDTESGAKDKLRVMQCKFNPLSRCDGSVMYSQGATVVIAAVLGPIEVKTQNLSIEGSYLECNYRPKAGLPQVKERIREAAIKDVLELALLSETYPRSKMSVQVQELEDRGSIDACALNAACLAMLIGGLPLKYSFAAVHCIINEEGEFVLDPEQNETTRQQASFTFAFDSVEGNLLLVQTKGAFKIAQFNDIECICRAASAEIFEFYRSNIAKYHGRSAEESATTKESRGILPMET